jgi:hypothetical protein
MVYLLYKLYLLDRNTGNIDVDCRLAALGFEAKADTSATGKIDYLPRIGRNSGRVSANRQVIE